MERCHDISTWPLRRSALEPSWLATSIYSQLLPPFVDVFCLFCDDLGGIKRVARHVASWIEDVSATTPVAALSRVLLVTQNILPSPQSEREVRLAFLRFLKEGTRRNVFDYISAIDVVLFPADVESVGALHIPLKERLMSGLDQVRRIREERQILFSITHFAAFLDSALRHFADAGDEPFNFIQASRACNPVAGDLKEHLSNFLRLIKSRDELTTFAAPIIASSLYLDNYSPDAHRK